MKNSDKKIKYVLFDLDGTVSDSSEGIVKSVLKALQSEGFDEKAENLYKFIGPSLRYSFGLYAKDDAQRDRMLSKFRERYRTIGWTENRMYEGMDDLFRSLKSADKKVILASAKPEEFCIKILKLFNVFNLFDFVGGADFEGKRDDKTILLKYVFDNIGNPSKDEMIMVGDRFYDIEAAHNNGIKCIGVQFGFSQGDELKNYGADYIVESVSALNNLLLSL